MEFEEWFNKNYSLPGKNPLNLSFQSEFAIFRSCMYLAWMMGKDSVEKQVIFSSTPDYYNMNRFVPTSDANPLYD